jgi:hypothetical protein
MELLNLSLVLLLLMLQCETSLSYLQKLLTLSIHALLLLVVHL